MAVLPNDPLIWFDFSQGNCNPVSLTVPNLGTMGGVLNCTSGVTFNGNINSGVMVLNNPNTVTGKSAYMDVYQQSLTAPLHRDATWVITICFPDTIPNWSFGSVMSMGPAWNFAFLGVYQTSVVNVSTPIFSSTLTAKRFYTFIRTSSSNDFLLSVKAYDHYSQSYKINHNNTSPLGSIEQNFRGTPSNSTNGMIRFAAYYSGAANSNLDIMVGDFAYWPYGMSSAQIEDVISYHKHRYSQNPVLP